MKNLLNAGSSYVFISTKKMVNKKGESVRITIDDRRVNAWGMVKAKDDESSPNETRRDVKCSRFFPIPNGSELRRILLSLHDVPSVLLERS